MQVENFRQKNIIEKALNYIGDNAHVVLFTILGSVLVAMTFAVIYFFKEYYITYLRKNDHLSRGFYYKYVQLKPHFKNILYFSTVLLAFWAGLIFLTKKWRYFAFQQGMLVFITGYSIYIIYYYIIKKNEFDLLDDIIFLYSKIKKNKVGEKTKME